jgi:hypothetical protein
VGVVRGPDDEDDDEGDDEDDDDDEPWQYGSRTSSRASSTLSPPLSRSGVKPLRGYTSPPLLSPTALSMNLSITLLAK